MLVYMSHKTTNYKVVKRGFTIIEVIIVLVIAAIIMVMVFLIVPQLRTNQRNNQRRSDANRMLAAAERLAADSGGSYSSTTINAANILGITGAIKNPSTNTDITLVLTDAATTNATNYDSPGKAEITLGKGCNTKPTGTTPTGTGRVAITIGLEGGNSYCTSFP